MMKTTKYHRPDLKLMWINLSWRPSDVHLARYFDTVTIIILLRALLIQIGVVDQLPMRHGLWW